MKSNTTCDLLLATGFLLSFPALHVTIKDVDVLSLYRHPRHQGFVLGHCETDRSKKRALLLHGFPGTPAELRPLAEFLLARGFEVRAPLLPGFGAGMAALGRTRWRDWVGAAQTAWDDLSGGAEETLLLGFSMGGAVALNVAARTPPDRLVLIAPFWRLPDRRAGLLPLVQFAVPQLKPCAQADFATESVRAQVARIDPTLNLDDPDVQQALREQLVLPTSSLVALQRLGSRAYRAAPKVKAPTLVFQGKDDPTVRAADTRRLAARLDGPVTFSELEGDHQLVEAESKGHRELLEQLGQLCREQKEVSTEP